VTFDWYAYLLTTTYTFFFQSDYFYLTTITCPPVKITADTIKKHLSSTHNGIELIFEGDRYDKDYPLTKEKAKKTKVPRKRQHAKKQHEPSTSEDELNSDPA
jgi:hypothetical protein